MKIETRFHFSGEKGCHSSWLKGEAVFPAWLADQSSDSKCIKYPSRSREAMCFERQVKINIETDFNFRWKALCSLGGMWFLGGPPLPNTYHPEKTSISRQERCYLPLRCHQWHFNALVNNQIWKALSVPVRKHYPDLTQTTRVSIDFRRHTY